MINIDKILKRFYFKYFSHKCDIAEVLENYNVNWFLRAFSDMFYYPSEIFQAYATHLVLKLDCFNKCTN